MSDLFLGGLMYTYNFKLDRVVDGDTVDGYIDLGFNITIKQRVRLLNINAPESRTRDLKEKAMGLRSKEYLKMFLQLGDLVVQTKLDKRGKFGRVLGTLILTYASGVETNVNQYLVDNGYAVEKIYE